MVSRVYSVGHSTRTADEFVALLAAHDVRQIADVRTVPRSRRHPHFSRDAMEAWLPQQRIAYRHFPWLGGLRKPRPDSRNSGWTHPSFRGYADYMETPAFAAGLEALLEHAARATTAVMCAEAVWWRCHRQLIADALLVRGVEVWHLLGTGEAKPHRLTPFARVRDGMLSYPDLLDDDTGVRSGTPRPDGRGGSPNE